MKISFRKNKFKVNPEINIINLIDIIFVINIFLFLTTTFAVSQTNSIEVNLPSASHAKEVITDDKKNIVITIDKMENIYYNNEKITIEKLNNILAEKRMLISSPNLIVSADNLCTHGKIVEILDLAKKYGIYNLNIATKKQNGEKNVRKQTASNKIN